MGSQNCYDGLDRYAIAIIRRKARQLGRQLRCSPADIEQELAMDLHVRLRRYDPQKLSRRVFIAEILDHKVATILERERAAMRDPSREERSMDEPLPDGEDGGETAFGDTVDAEIGRGGLSREDLPQLRADLAAVMQSLPARERQLMALLLDDPNVRKAARKLGVHHSTAYECLDNVRKRFAKAGLQEYLRKRPTHRGRLRY
jgi:hypothetical protein